LEIVDSPKNPLYVLSGCGLKKYEAAMASGVSNGQVLEYASPPETGEWIRRCGNLHGGKNTGSIAAGAWAVAWENGCCN
jgi:hypothetical protein